MICEIDYPMDKSSWKGLGGSIGRERADIGEVLSLGIIVFPVQRYEKERRIQEKPQCKNYANDCMKTFA